jgi:hypothetical protein
MPSLFEAIRLASLIQVVLYACLAARLFRAGLWRTYRFFAVLVCYEIVRTLVAGSIPLRTNTYAYFYFLTQPITWFLHAMVVLEVFRVALRSHPGVSTVGRYTVTISVVLAVVMSLGSLLVAGQGGDTRYLRLETFFLLERVIYSSLLVFVLLLAGFLAYYPVPLTRNAMVHTTVLGVYFISRATLWVVRNLAGPDLTSVLNLSFVLLVCLCVASWAVFLTPAGEAEVTRVRRYDAADEERLVAQLDALNNSLSRAAKK